MENEYIIIGVITPYERSFRMWKLAIGIARYPKAMFKKIDNNPDNIIGVYYDKIVCGYDCSKVSKEYVDMALAQLKK